MRQKYDKTEIIDKGVQLFRQKGYHNTGVDDILRSCGIPSGSFYNFFKNKEGFAVQALELYNQRYLNTLDQLLADVSVSPLERLRRLFSGSIKMHVEQDCSMGCLLNSMTSEVAALNINIGKLAAEHYQRNAEKLADVISAGQDLGEIRKDFSALELAFYLIDAFAGATVRMQAGKTDQPLKLFLRTAFEFLRNK
jgi:TetR/AcrR family transcriptional repressor of nem operon